MIKNEPLVTVIILSYNHKKFLPLAIESVINQTYKNLEIIISDDCSTDDSMQIIKSYNDIRIRSILNQHNLGAAINHNNAIKEAKGEYIAILNSDDYFDIKKIDLQVKFLEENKHYGAVFSRAFIINEDNEVINKSKYFDVDIFNQINRERTEWIRKFFFEQNCLCHPSVLIRREVYFKTELYNPSLKQLPDFKMWTDIIKFTNIYILQDKLVYYRILSKAKNTSAIKNNNVVRHNNEMVLIMNSFFENLDKQDFISSFKNDLIFKDACSDIELSIEQAFLYLKMQNKLNYLYHSLAIERLYNLLQNEESKDVLQKKYNFNYNDFFELTGVTGYTSLSKYDIYKKDEMNNIDKLVFVIKKIRKYI